jgi:dihydroxyacetone kinase-like predicted kinase
MSGAAARLVSGFVTRAARAIKQPVALREGQSFAALDGTIVEGSNDDAGALIALVQAMLKRQTDGALLTLYQGLDVDPDEAATTKREVEAVLGEEVEVELVIGGQPHYPWLASLE